jgi:hypothetical protein
MKKISICSVTVIFRKYLEKGIVDVTAPAQASSL